MLPRRASPFLMSGLSSSATGSSRVAASIRVRYLRSLLARDALRRSLATEHGREHSEVLAMTVLPVSDGVRCGLGDEGAKKGRSSHRANAIGDLDGEILGAVENQGCCGGADGRGAGNRPVALSLAELVADEDIDLCVALRPPVLVSAAAR